MKKAILAATAAALAAAGVTASADTAPKRKAKPKDSLTHCLAPGASTLVANGDVRVYTRDLRDSGTGTRTAISLCLFSNGRRYRIGVAEVPFDDDPRPAHYIRSIKITSQGGGVPGFFAYVSTKCTEKSCAPRVVLRSMRTGKTILRRKAGSGFDRLALSQTTDPGDYSLAWLETSPGGDCASGCRVHRVQKSGDKVLDEGTDINSDLFGELDSSAPGIIEFAGDGGFVWKRGETIKHANWYLEGEQSE